MPGDQIWPIVLLGISLLGNLILLFQKPIRRLLRREEKVSEDNIMAMVEEGEESGAIQSNEKTLIENVFDFDTMTARDVMVHRTDMVTLDVDDDDETVMEAIRTSGLSRFPVYQEDVDDIVGVLSTREYLLNCRLPQPKPMKDLLRPAYFVPETVPTDVLFRDMQGKKTHMALVVDEYGGMCGIITVTDLVEQLVGDFDDDETERQEPELERLDSKTWKIRGTCSLHDVAKALDHEFSDAEEYETFSGFLIGKLGEIPKDGSIGEVIITKDYIEKTGGPTILLRGQEVPKLEQK